MPRGTRYFCPECGGAVSVPAHHDRADCPYCRSHLLLKNGLRGRAPLISMDCPGCGASVHMPEDANTLRCSHCGGAHLLTGEGRPLRFYVPLQISEEEAKKEALAIIPHTAGARGAAPVFVPYWRMHGTMFHWESKTRRLRSKALDRSMPAGDFGIGLPSLGARLIRVNQHPYDRSEILKHGRVLNPILDAKKAEATLCDGAYHAFRDQNLENKMEHGSIIRRKMSLVWYPYWLMWVGTRRIVVDGACRGVIGSPGRLKSPKDAIRIHSDIPSLIAAVCPNCGGDFSIDGFEALYYCRYCQECWRPEGRRLVGQEILFVRCPAGDAKATHHLPVWRMQTSLKNPTSVFSDQKAFRKLIPGWSYAAVRQDPKKPFFVYVPAWGNRLNPRMSAFAQRWTREQPDIQFEKRKFIRVFRALYGPREAEELALITLLGVAHKCKPEIFLNAELNVSRCELLLVPSRKGSPEWIESVMETAIPYFEMAEREF